MAEEITKDNLPSKTYYEEVHKCIKFDEIEMIIINDQDPSAANEWIGQFMNYSEGYLKTYTNEGSTINGDKRCRDYIYSLVAIKKYIEQSKNNRGSYKIIVDTIDNFVTSLGVYGYDNCSMISENDYSNVDNMKKLDDFLQNITYIKSKLEQVNKSSHCNDIKTYMQIESLELKDIDRSNIPKYSEILKYYDVSENYAFDEIPNLISCTTAHNSLSEVAEGSTSHSKLSGRDTFLSAFFPLVGVSVISFFLHKHTSLGSWLNNRILNRTISKNILNEDKNDNILEQNYEPFYTDTHNEGYNLSYYSS
ncbi:hypothetical protein, conserved [Plasmodium ovale]|uniref:PIR protein n=1 Tax=Plasmodium ovale TaxID=36330 RepID=A0A1C3KIR0_PLAOA|nr:hypothetical protein, conserved [Plasmodium ovale]